MSTSSVGSQASIGFHGREVGLEEGLDETIRSLINHMNNVQMALRHIAVIAEQDQDYSSELKLSWDIDEDLLQMTFLFDDLRAMSLDLITIPDTPEEKAAAKKFKIDLKEHQRKATAEHTTNFKADRAASKLAMKAAKLAMVDENHEMKE